MSARPIAEVTAVRSRLTLWLFLAGLAIAIASAACQGTGGQETPLGDGAGTPDAAEAMDVSVSVDGSLTPDGGGNSSPDVDDVAIDAIDETDASEEDAADSVTDPALDNAIDDAPAESSDSDAGIEDSDSGPPDDSAIADVDAAVPDGSEPINPTFPTCAYMPSIQDTPYAIIDALPSRADKSLRECHCTSYFQPLTYRVLCGSYTPPAIVNYDVCGIPLPPTYPAGGREIFIVSGPGCPFHLDAGVADMWIIQHRPVSDWDALLAEQIAGHADAGGHD